MHRIIRVDFHVEIDLPRQAVADPNCVNAGPMLSLEQQVVDLARKNVTLWQMFLSRTGMKRFTLLAIVMGSLWAGAAQAADAGVCKSMCSTERRECRAEVRGLAAEDGKPLLEMNERNPMARAAQERVPTPAGRALDNAGTQTRRLDKAAQCDVAYQRCVRACAAPADSILVKPAAGR
jgi:hypothetical protein